MSLAFLIFVVSLWMFVAVGASVGDPPARSIAPAPRRAVTGPGRRSVRRSTHR
jgi:hypothetical protein